ncbi:MAG: CxxxxCH/CxxCH domain-containing protein [Chloroflexi bacterium]|nr:CxxxxCH/CxxCH domain-containing protein [Chloroflexota bacterium]
MRRGPVASRRCRASRRARRQRCRSSRCHSPGRAARVADRWRPGAAGAWTRRPPRRPRDTHRPRARP